MKRLLIAALLCASAFPQAVQTGGRFTGSVVFGEGPTGSGPLLTYSARTDLCENAGDTGCAATPTCPTLSSTGNCNPVGCTSCSGAAMLFTNSPINGIPGSNHLPIPGPASTISCGTQGTLACNYQYPNGINTVITDPDFHTQSVRATDYSLAGVQGRAFNVGSAGTYHFWLSDDSGFFVPNTGGGYALMAFTPANWNTSAGTCTGCISASSVYGPAIAGIPSTSGTSPNLFYVFKTDQENTVFYSSLTGACSTPDVLTQASTGATATLQAINVGFVQFGIVTVSTAYNTHAWSDSGSCVITPNSGYSAPPFGDSPTTGAPYANTLYKGLLNSSGLPSTWSVTYSMLFNFNYVASMTSSPAAAYFPAGANTCLPANYNGQWSGTFQNSLDDTAWSSPLSDDGQVYAWGQAQTSCSTSPGGVCTGPVYYVTYILGHGCRTVNTRTNQISDDNPSTQYPVGQAINGQRYYILGTVIGTPTLPTPSTTGGLLTQAVTGAQAEYKGTGALHTGLQPPSCSPSCSFTYSQWQNSLTSPTGWEIGYIYGTPDATHCWGDGAISGSLCTGNYITPSALPQPEPFYYPTVIHDANQGDNAATASINSDVGFTSIRVATERIGYPVAGQTTLTFYANGDATPPAACSAPGLICPSLNEDEQFHFYNIGSATAGYLACTDVNHCPAWTVVSGGAGVSSMVILDSVATPGSSCVPTSGYYTCSEETTACSMTTPVSPCPLMTSNAPGYLGNYSDYDYPEYWQIASLTMNPCLSINCQGHAAHGSIGDARATKYWYFYTANPSTPCLVSGYSPCPHGDTFPLLTTPLVQADNHGMYENHGSGDLAPFGLITTHVCLLGNGVGTNSCNSPFTSALQSEIIAVENSVTSNVGGQCLGTTGPGCHCNYGSGPTGCTYRFGNTFGTDSSWDFNAQNTIGNISYDGKFALFPSDIGASLGCSNGTTNCWAPYIASPPPAATATSVAWSTDSSSPPIVTFTMPNSFCPTGGSQYYPAGTGTITAVSTGSGQSVLTTALAPLAAGDEIIIGSTTYSVVTSTLNTVTVTGTVTGTLPISATAVQLAACGSQPELIALTGFSTDTGNTWTIPNNTIFTITANTSNAWGCTPTSATPNCTKWTAQSVTNSNIGGDTAITVPPSANGTFTGTLKAWPLNCVGGSGIPANSVTGVNTYCQRSDIWVANLQTAH